MNDTSDAVGGIIDAANRTLRSLELIEVGVKRLSGGHTMLSKKDMCRIIVAHVADARKELLAIKALF